MSKVVRSLIHCLSYIRRHCLNSGPAIYGYVCNSAWVGIAPGSQRNTALRRDPLDLNKFFHPTVSCIWRSLCVLSHRHCHFVRCSVFDYQTAYFRFQILWMTASGLHRSVHVFIYSSHCSVFIRDKGGIAEIQIADQPVSPCSGVWTKPAG